MTGKVSIHLARAYDDLSQVHGARLLVDRLWPRGVQKEHLHLSEWTRDIAPSNALRQWFGHDPDKWQTFRQRYTAELDNNPEAVAQCAAWLHKGAVTLLYVAKDREHNNAVVLAEYLAHHVKKKRKS